jgi:cobalt-zinc-cadmium efflux system membrane fusion protein
VQVRQVAVFDAVAAEKRLRLKGADSEAIAALRALLPKVVSTEPCLCDDPNCAEGTLPSVAETLGKDGRLAWYALRAPLAGMLIEKHIVMGESLDTTSEVFTIADLSSVWVDLTVSQDAMLAVQTGQTATVTLPDGTTAAATITFVSPLVARETRTALARAILENRDERFRPGTFIEAAIQVPSAGAAVVVPKASVQLVDDYPCLFVWNQGAFELREVTTGNDDGRQVEILKGLKAGEAVASVNAFHLKAEYIKSAAGERGAHEGHSH